MNITDLCDRTVEVRKVVKTFDPKISEILAEKQESAALSVDYLNKNSGVVAVAEGIGPEEAQLTVNGIDVLKKPTFVRGRQFAGTSPYPTKTFFDFSITRPTNIAVGILVHRIATFGLNNDQADLNGGLHDFLLVPVVNGNNNHWIVGPNTGQTGGPAIENDGYVTFSDKFIPPT
jgi:hypothetical protein